MYTPLELQKVTFQKSALGGYKKEDVEDVFELVVHDYEEMYKENIALKDKIAMLNDLVQKYKAMEETMQNALLVAQRASEELKQNAAERAQQILKEAELQSKSILANSSEEITKLQMQKENMRQSVSGFAAKIIAMLNAQIDLMNQLSGDARADEAADQLRRETLASQQEPAMM